jgi:ribonuclease HI
MKKLKLDHELAQLVIAGKKTTTWRLFDDKDLTVNDTVELIDKVNPEKPETWQVIGTAIITHVLEKRLGDVSDVDTEMHEKFETPEAMLQKYQGYYGPNVTWDTLVKIVHFDFYPKGSDEMFGARRVKIDAVKVFGDGGSRGNPGPSASGFVILDMKDTVLVDRGVYIGMTTNNQAEYTALKLGLEEAKKMGAKRVEVYMDSMLVVNQLKGIFKVKNRELWALYDAIKTLAASFEQISFTHVPRELNKLADAAVNRALDEELGITRSQKLS